MNRALPIVTLALGLALGFFLGHKTAPDQDAGLAKTRDAAGEDLVKRSEFEAELARLRAEKDDAQNSANAAFGREKATREEAERLKGELAALHTRLEGYVATADAAVEDRAVRLDRIEKRFRELEGKGLQNLISTNAIGKLIADLRQEGDLGREAVLALLASESADDRQLAATLLMQGMADPETIGPLKEVALNDADEMTKRLASQALMRTEGDEVVGALEELAANASDEGVRVNSMYGLMMRGRGVDQAVAYYENQENSLYMRQALGQSAFLLNSKPEVQPLIDAIVKECAGTPRANDVTEAAIDYYKSVKSPSAVAALQKIAADPNSSAAVKEKASAALTEIGNN